MTAQDVSGEHVSGETCLRERKCFREIVYGNRKRSGAKSGNSAGSYIYVTKKSLFGKLLNLAHDGLLLVEEGLNLWGERLTVFTA